ncbi:hypothetical protein [Brevibacillus laterosporus]|uniref:hypothetical protein n=1 Tax=Brevibacillus laterosporus TaxID=1465 RepID=UPI003B98655B
MSVRAIESLTKFSLPEHAEVLRQLHEDKKLIEKLSLKRMSQPSFVTGYLTHVSMTMR